MFADCKLEKVIYVRLSMLYMLSFGSKATFARLAVHQQHSSWCCVRAMLLFQLRTVIALNTTAVLIHYEQTGSAQ